jgi:hypothetical protein
MDLAKRYQDSGDNPRNILEMVELEPYWAANRIQAGEMAEKQNAEMKVLLRDIYLVCGASSRASHREQTEIFQRLRKALGISL